MSKWNYKINSENLRESIQAENKNKIMQEIINIWKDIKNINTEIVEDSQEEIDEYIEDINLRINDEDVENKTIDGFLNELYNFCDDLKIWLEL